ncbi:MAG TPA: response regulator transcription factor [Rubrobacteraceae bacterium]|nr:response regulator transcription factor [Rubrobacteraceae bacterium]
MDPVRVLIADDHPLFRAGMSGLLDSVPDTEVVGEASTGREAVEMAKTLAPDVILMDIKMPDLNGIAATREVLVADPEVAVLVVTMLEDDDSVFAAMRAGAAGYMLKGAQQAEVLGAIRAVARGQAIFGPGIARRVMGFFSTGGPAAPPHAFPELSEREQEILSLIARGRSNPEISRDLFLSPKTVQNHVSSIYRKLRVADRAQAVIRAREAGLGRNDPYSSGHNS